MSLPSSKKNLKEYLNFLFVFILLNFVISNAFAVDNATTTAEIAKYKQSWVAKALALQREMDLNTPFSKVTFLGTHNSYNSSSYMIPFVRYVDPNHTLSVYQQLELGIRSIEYDVHWTWGRGGKKNILLCHGLPQHVGCGTFDRPIAEGLEELRSWLKDNPKEIVLLYIERHLDGHEPRLAALLDQHLGSYIYKPNMIQTNQHSSDQSFPMQNSLTTGSNQCRAIPSSLTKADILKAGKQLLIVAKGCDGLAPPYLEQNIFPFFWNDYVFAGIGDIQNHPFTFIDSTFDIAFKGYPSCGDGIFTNDPSRSSLWRLFEDRTRLSNASKKQRIMLPADISEMMRCNINWPAMDMLKVNDPRLEAAVWSWAASYPKENNGHCARFKNKEGIQNYPCQESLDGFICEEERTSIFTIVAAKGTWEEGEKVCQMQAGKTWHFSIPTNGTLMYVVKLALENSGLAEVWTNYRQDENMHWTQGKP